MYFVHNDKWDRKYWKVIFKWIKLKDENLNIRNDDIFNTSFHNLFRMNIIKQQKGYKVVFPSHILEYYKHNTHNMF
jgi:hypothetical protein